MMLRSSRKYLNEQLVLLSNLSYFIFIIKYISLTIKVNKRGQVVRTRR
ncbi:MAG: hypothetical protein BAJALOKI1v1_700014 [Promethearchaeota archaeon]|nr:MAG: hypothetical protein BAJALOKI1v1_700014 [Candidatus Lokiarchaeota archaeon]